MCVGAPHLKHGPYNLVCDRQIDSPFNIGVGVYISIAGMWFICMLARSYDYTYSNQEGPLQVDPELGFLDGLV